MLITVAELPAFQRRAEKLLSEEERHDLLTVFAKNKRADLSQAERNELAKLVKVLIETALGN